MYSAIKKNRKLFFYAKKNLSFFINVIWVIHWKSRGILLCINLSISKRSVYNHNIILCSILLHFQYTLLLFVGEVWSFLNYFKFIFLFVVKSLDNFIESDNLTNQSIKSARYETENNITSNKWIMNIDSYFFLTWQYNC